MQTADIVIIGGGIIGASIAYALAQRGTQHIMLLERDSIASGSSGRATGGIRQQFADELDIRFSLEGVRFYEQFTREQSTASQRPAFLQYGYLFLVTQAESWQAMQRHVALQQSLGVPTQLLTPTEVQQHIPQLFVDDVIGASFCASDGYSDPGAMAHALLQEAWLMGVDVREQRPVTGIRVERGRVRAVNTPQETIATSLVVNAAGVYAAEVAQLASITDLPVYPLRRQLFLTEPCENVPDTVPMTVDLHTGFHFRRRGKQVLLTMPLPMSQEQERENRARATQAFDLTPDEQFWPRVHAETQRRYPALANVPLARTWVGLYEMTPDEHPILGKTDIEGFLCACGFSGHGFMHAPMAAKLLSELLLDGESHTLPLELFSIERFRSGKLLATTRLL